ncbi:porin [Citrobacter koseri]|uniref:porin n=1 Tax=Citrobacter koseri TaxID=545 RepID=UPI000DFC807C|nr:porin [Citrobacter koseri]STB73282.1 outer membrane protein N (porin) [Citrobacter koseri]STT23462.1 outer membrane pore protein N, non-specific [Citrobacter koseri]
MKHNTIAVVTIAMFGAAGVNAAEIYNQDGNELNFNGKVGGLHYFSSEPRDNGDQSYLRVGFDGQTQIAPDLIGYGQWEYNVQANNTEVSGNQSWSRLAYVGLKSQELGSFDYGRNYGVLYDIESMTDVLPEFGGDSWAQVDNYMSSRANGVATWRADDLLGMVPGLDLAVQYQGKNEGAGNGNEGTNNGRDLRFENGDGMGASAVYNLGKGVSLGAAYASSDRTIAQRNAGSDAQFASGKRAEAWSSGLKFDADNVYVAANYTETLNMTPFGTTNSAVGGGIANKTRNAEMTAQYQFDSGLRPSVAYLESRGEDLNTAYGNKKSLVKYIDLGATYYFNKNMSTYVDYKINLLNGRDDFYRDNGIGTDDIVATGLVYQF